MDVLLNRRLSGSVGSSTESYEQIEMADSQPELRDSNDKKSVPSNQSIKVCNSGNQIYGNMPNTEIGVYEEDSEQQLYVNHVPSKARRQQVQQHTVPATNRDAKQLMTSNSLHEEAVMYENVQRVEEVLLPRNDSENAGDKKKISRLNDRRTNLLCWGLLYVFVLIVGIGLGIPVGFLIRDYMKSQVNDGEDHVTPTNTTHLH